MGLLRRLFSLSMPKGHDNRIHILVLSIAIFGWFMIVSAKMGDLSSGTVVVFDGIKQAAFIIVGYIAMVKLAQFFTFDLFKSLLPAIIIGTIVLLLLPLGFEEVNGAHAWILVQFAEGYSVSIQPSEFSKLVVILVMAYYLGDYMGERNAERHLFFGLGISAVITFIVFVLQSDLGSAVVIGGIVYCLLMIPRNKQYDIWQTRITYIVLAVFLLVFFMMSPLGQGLIQASGTKNYQLLRFSAAANPFSDQYNSGYQLIKGLIAFATGGFKGVGYGASIQKYSNFPAADTDYIFAVVVEELGLLGMLFVIGVYFLIILFLFQNAFKMKKERNTMVCVGAAMYLFIHFFFNVGGVTGLIPLTGVPLLLLSAGGSSTVSFMMAIGLAQAVIISDKQN